jgi:hypothetical protein
MAAREDTLMSLGTLCLALFLIIWGIVTLTGASFQGVNIVLGLLAIVADIAMLVGSSVVLRP